MEQYISKSALVAEIRKRLLPVVRDKHYDEWEEGQNSERISILDIINTLEVKEVQEESVSEDFETILAEEWKDYNGRGAATVDALEDNTQELAFAKGFYRGWHYNKEKPVSEDLEEAANKYIKGNYSPWLYKAMFDCFKAGAKWQKKTDESTTNDLGECLYELSKQFPEVSFAKLSRIGVRVAKWQKEHLLKFADKEDYSITICFDKNGESYWNLSCKGQSKFATKEEMLMVSGTLGLIKKRIDFELINKTHKK